ncbi:hypothetical protein PR003_g14994 [Phytophthora rubi]|uniref:RxLR effector protein n=1 Tax=Phytophthora rubi TaxID=129364 RepID=A0A6A4F129_9STRA|nr:hypothetical protein PR003_g14994 [Phytophthora rubi]
MVIAASFLVASEAISTTTDSNQVEKLTPLDHQRLLRTHHYEAAEDEAETEERGPISKAQMKALFEEVGIDWKMVKANPNYLQMHSGYEEYLEKVNAILTKQKSKGAPVYKNY